LEHEDLIDILQLNQSMGEQKRCAFAH
jgi:hypothetical protein